MKNALLIAGLAAALSAAGGPALAQSGTWTLNNAGNWSSGGSWQGGVIAGSTTATNSTDTAWFSANLTGARTVTVDSNRNIRNITFDNGNSSTFGYTLSGGSLLLTSGGTISSTGSLGAHTDTISAPMTILGNNAIYTISNDSTLATRLLSISGAITGQSTTGGTTTLILGGNATGTNSLSSSLSAGSGGGAIAVVKEGSGTWRITNPTGGLERTNETTSWTINGGTLLVPTENQNAAALGASTKITLANVAGAQLDFGTGVHNRIIGFGSLSGGGANGGNIVNAGYANSGIFIGFDNTSTTFGGRFISGTAGGGITKVGTGTLTLTGSGNDAGGTTTIRGGAIGLDFSQAWAGTDILASTRAVSLQGGRLLLTGSNAATNSQTINNVTVAQGNSGIALTSNGANNLLLSAGTITRSTGGTLDITLPTGSQSTTNGVRTTTTTAMNSVLATANSNGLAYATVSGTTWAGLSSGNIVALSSYATGNTNYTATNNVDVTNGDTISTGTVNTLRFNGSNTLNLTGTTTIRAGGVLVTSAASAGAAFSGGTLQPGGGNELVLINNGSLLTVGSVIANNASAAAVTLAGTGGFRLNGNNTYTGATTISSGTVTLGSATALGASGSSAVWIGDNPTAALDLNGFDISIGSLAGAGGSIASVSNAFGTPGGRVLMGVNSLTAGANNTSTTYGGRISGSGTFTKAGTGNLTFSGSSAFAGFSGSLVVENGTLTVGSVADTQFGTEPLGTATVYLGKIGGGTANARLDVTGSTGRPIVLVTGNSGTMTIGQTTSSRPASNTVVSGSITGAGDLVIIREPQSASFTVSGLINHSGNLTLRKTINSSSALSITGGIGSNVVNVTLDQSSLGNANDSAITIGGTIAATGTISNISSGTTAGALPTINGVITNASRLVQNSGSLTLVLNAANTFAGDVLVQSGTLRLDNAQAIQNTSGVSISGPGILNINASGAAITQNIANSGQIISGLTSGTATISGAISGTGSVSLSSAITMILSGSNSYTGLTTLGGGGVLSIDSANALAGGSNLTFTNGTLRFGTGVTTDLAARIKNSSGAVGINTGSNAAVTFAAAIDNTNSGGLTKSGTGTLFLSAVNTYTGTTTVNAGTLAVTGAGSIVSTGAVNVNGSGATFDISEVTASGLTIGSLSGTSSSFVTLGGKTLTVGDATSTTFSGTIGGTGGLTKVGAGSLTLAGKNTFSGDTLISSGTLVTSDYQALQFSGLDTSGAGVINAGGPTRGGLNFGGLIGSKNLANVIVNTGSAFAAITLNSQAGRSYAYSGNIVDINAGTTMQLRKNGVGTQILSGSNSYTGATEVNAGVLRLDSVNAIPGGIGSTGAGGNLKFDGGVIGLGAGDFTRALGTGTNTNQVSFTAAGAGGGFAAYGDNRVVNLGGASATATWNNGSFVPTNGALILGAADATHMVDFQNPIALGLVPRTVQVNRGSGAVDARLSGALSSSGSNGGLTKTGAGVLEITAVNTYSGTTAINAGRFLVSGAGNLSNTARVVVAGSDADFRWNSSTAFTQPLTMTQGTISGTGTISASGGVSIGTGAMLSPGNSPGIQAYTTGLTWAGGGSYIWEINDWTGNAGTAFDQLAVSGSALDITATSGSPFTILITSLTGANAAGNVPNFNDNVSKTFTIATSTVPISGFDASKFTLNTSSFSNTYSGSWSLSATGSTVLLNYTAPVTTTTGSYSLSAAAGAATIIAGGSSTITATITNTGAGTADAINYSSLGVGNGVTISPSSGSNLAQAASGTGTGVFTSLTPGLYTFDPTASVTNSSLGGAAVLSGSTATSVTVLDHATSSLSSSLTPLLSSTISLGTWDYQSQSWTDGNGTNVFSIYNLNPNSLDPSLVALLDLTGTSAIGDTGFTLDAGLNPGSFAMIAGGTSAAYSVSFNPTGLNSQGTFTRTFTFNMADQNLPGSTATNTLTVTAAVIVVPEPGAIALAGIGIAAAAYALLRRRR